jgi:hypothetical protein
VLLKINLTTKEIVAYWIDWPYFIHWSVDEQSAIKPNTHLSEFQPPFKGYQVTDPRLVAIVLEARMHMGEMEAVLDDNNCLIDIHITYPDLGEDR